MSDRTRQTIYIGLFTAIIATLSQISIPMPSGIPITLQTLAIALCGSLLGWKYGVISTAVYILIGSAGVPVFSNFRGGIGVLFGITGGFIWGFLLLVILCGIASKVTSKILGIILCIIGIICCHIVGVGQYMVITGTPLVPSVLLISLPYIVKDILSAAVAFFISEQIKKRSHFHIAG
ncbi:MAG: biotin transporter BioY [Clostridia bacterium]